MKKFLFATAVAILLASCATHDRAIYQVKHGKVSKLTQGQTPDCIRNW